MRMDRRAAVIVVVGAAAAWGGAGPAAPDLQLPTVSPLTLIETPTPRFPVPRFATYGAYPEVRGAGLDLGRVNDALRAAVLTDERAYAPYARKEKRRVTG
jgi:hypothetical protein